MRRKGACGLLLLLVASVARAESLSSQVNEAIRLGVESLMARQGHGGRFRSGYEKHFPGGPTALAVYALAKSGVSPDDPAIQAALRALRDDPPERVYSVAALVLALDALDAKEHDAWIRALARWLVRQRPRNESLWNYGPHTEGENPVDISNTQFAVLGLWAAERHGYRASRAVWRDLARRVPALQGSSGAFVYRTGFWANGGMTTAGMTTLALALDRIPRRRAGAASRAGGGGAAAAAAAGSTRFVRPQMARSRPLPGPRAPGRGDHRRGERVAAPRGGCCGPHPEGSARGGASGLALRFARRNGMPARDVVPSLSPEDPELEANALAHPETLSLEQLRVRLPVDPDLVLRFDEPRDVHRVAWVGVTARLPEWRLHREDGAGKPPGERTGLVRVEPPAEAVACRAIRRVTVPPGATLSLTAGAYASSSDANCRLRIGVFDGRLHWLEDRVLSASGWTALRVPLSDFAGRDVLLLAEVSSAGPRRCQTYFDEMSITAAE